MLLLFNAVLPNAFALDPDTPIFPSLQGVFYKESRVTTAGLRTLSMAGGAPIVVQGAMMAAMPNNNKIIFQSKNLNGVEFEGPPLSEGDINFSTNTAEGRLGYSLPSVMKLFNTDFNQFNGETLPNGVSGAIPFIGFDMKILNQDNLWYAGCATAANCEIRYSRDYTPYLLAVTPSNVVKDQLIQFHVNAKNTQSTAGTPADEWPFREIKLDETFVMWTNGDFDGGTVTQDRRLAGYQRDTIEAYVGKQFPAKNSEPRLLFYPGYAYNQPAAKSCNFVGDDCWTVRTHAKIDSISDNTGYTNGGQTLTINGWGLRSKDVKVTIDDVPCQVENSNLNEKLTCTTGKALADSDTLRNRPGQPGIQREKLETSDGIRPSFANFNVQGQLYPVVETTLLTSFEAYAHFQDNNYGQRLSGWFVAPETAQYRFYMSCDDFCRLLLDSINPYSSGVPASPQVIATRYSWTNWRNYFHDVKVEGINQNHRSDWISLVKGESYYIEGHHVQATGGEHFTVSVEIQLTGGNPANHPKSNVQIQQLSVEQINTPESWSIVINNPDSGSYKLNFLNPTTNPASLAGPYGPISMTASAWDFQNAIAQYYREFFGTEISVVRTMTDVNGAVTTDQTLAKQILYQVTLLRQITGISINSISATKANSNATITITPPLKGQKSSAPLNGSYAITCTDPRGKQWTTPDIKYNTGHAWIQNIIANSIPFLADQVEIIPDYRYKYWENGISFMMKFSGIKGDVNLCSLQTGATTPLTGNNPDFSNSTLLMKANQSLFFEPIPLEFLRTNTQKPQVLITLDGQPALCPQLNCDFSYYTDSASISSQTKLGSNGLTLSVVGTNLPSTDILKVTYGQVDCAVTSKTSSSIDCTLADIPVAGTQTVQILTSKGIVPTDPSVFVPTPEPLVINSVTPNSRVNYLGGDILVFAGSGFGKDPSALNVTFEDGTVCDVITAQSTYFSCQTERFSATLVTPLIVTVGINEVLDQTQTISLLDQAQTSDSVTPNRLSPVLKHNLVIQLSSNYSQNVELSDLSVYLINDNQPKTLKKLYIISVDNTLKTLTVKFPGARSGNYRLRVVSNRVGRIDTDSLRLTVIGQVLDFQPRQGSIYGGTTITITGENFSNDPLDNPVMIGTNYCYVMSTSATQIKCKTDLLYNEHVGDEELIVFLKTSEEAVCNVQTGCLYSYIQPTTTVTSVDAAFDATSNKHIATVTGTGIDSTIRLVLDGIEQSLLPGLSSTSAQFEIVNIDDTNVTHVEVFTSEGYPEGAASLPYLLLTPSLLSISPLVGSAGGSQIVVTGTGFGPETKGLNLFDSLSNKVLCSSVKVVSYGVFTCQTVPGVITDGSGIKLQYGTLKLNSQAPAATSYTQVASFVISAVQLTTDQTGIVFTGQGFSQTGFVAVASFGGVDADNTVVDSDTQVTATWTSVGVAAITAKPVIRFTSDTNSQFVHFAQNNAAALTKALTVTPPAPVSCSFQGGCKYIVPADGLFAALKDQSNRIDVCGNTCVVDQFQSAPMKTVCTLPAISTAYSIQTFKTQSDSILRGTVFPNTKVLTDGDLTQDYVDPAATGCNFGMTFPPGQVGVLSEAKIFINFMVAYSPYVNNLALYGSNDNWATQELIDTFGENVHEGWNYFDFGDGNLKPRFNSYKFIGKTKGSCRVTEFKLIGVQTIFDENPDFACTPKVVIGSNTPVSLSPVTYSATNTPLLKSIWPRYGSVLGGDTVTLTGENFSDTALTTVKFDNRVCTVVSQSSTQIICTTSDKPYVPDTPKVEILIDGFGLVATQGLVFRYASLWSEPQTWGFDIPPQYHESISVPKGQHLLVDVDETPEIFAVIVEGSLIFPSSSDPNHHRTFDAHYIMINGGYMEVGTEEFPYTSHLTITMHGNKYSPSMPIFGNKVLSLHYGLLEMHGVTRSVTWTRLAQTASAGDTILVLDDIVDWQAGEEIVLAGTVFEPIEYETRFIASVNGNVVTLDRPLDYTHIGVVPTYGGIEMPMKGEVGLLTRNVLYRGNPDTSVVEQYGATIMVHSPGDDTSIARICYVEFKDVGQAFKLGRYPIHFHMIGHVMESHVIGNAIHQTYNRAITTHGVHYFHVQHNVAFDTMGHTFFIEDAIETNNYYDHNLAIKVASSFSLLNTDVTPGGFWITHPNNIFTNNAIANTDAYGYWFDMKEHSIGPSFDVNVCGFNDKLGRFYKNTAHSVHKYGLRIFHGLIPRTFPCRDTIYDGDYLLKNKTDPYWQNPIIPAAFEDSVFWRNGHAGAIMERSGAVQFKNLRCAENGIANMEWSLSENIADGYAKISGGLVVGDTGITPSVSQRLRGSLITGVITPRTENFTVEGVTFYNFDWSTAQALKDCSHCWHPASTDSGSRTVTTSNLTFDDASVPRRIRYEIPLRGIWYDLDGTLTGLGPNTWATKDFLHNRQPECTLDDAKYNGLICDSTIQVRRIVFHGYTPGSLKAMNLKIAKWDDQQALAIKADNTTLYNFQQDVAETYFSKVQWRQKLLPMDSWPVPFVTGHKYRMHFGWANDFETMTVTPSNRWTPSDKNVHIMTNFTDVRVAINVTTNKNALVANTSYLGKTEEQLVCGDNVIYNQTEVREFNFVVNGKDMINRNQLKLIGIRCWPGQCLPPVIIKPINDTQVYWSDPKSWPSGKVPVANETVLIDSDVNMVLDINTPILKMLTIKGRLSFLQNGTAQDITLNSYIVFVAGGELVIGNETNPFNGTATIKLYGISTDQSFAFDSAIQGGNKMLANLGLVSLWGQPRDRISRLRQPVYWGNTSALVSAGLDWVAGDRLYLAPTAIQHTHSDYVNIRSYDIQTGLVTFDRPLQYYHWGAYQSTAQDYNGVDMRGEVVLLTRNVRVVGDDTGSWGGQIITADTMDDLGTLVTGQLQLSNVEVYNCSQENTFQSAIRFEGATTKSHLVQNSVIHEGHGWPLKVESSQNILIKNTDFVGGRALGLVVKQSENVTLDGVMVADIIKRKLDIGGGNNFADFEGCVSICAHEEPAKCEAISVVNSIAAGCTYAGFIVPGHSCSKSATQQVFRNNVAHSIGPKGGGAIIYPDGSSEQELCYEGSHFAAYKCEGAGLAGMFITQRVIMTNVTMIDNVMGLSLQTGAELPINAIVIYGSKIYGETEAQDCPDPRKGWLCLCLNKMGFMLSGGNMNKKTPHITSASSLPMYKIKSYGAWNVVTDYQSMTFSNYKSKFTNCGAVQTVFGLNPFSSDYIPLQKFANSKFVEVADEAMAFIYDPPEEWNNPDDCLGFPCTAPSNVVMQFDRTQYAGINAPQETSPNFQIVSDTKLASENLRSCSFREAWNGWSCVNQQLGVLQFQSLDEDQEKRNISPVYVYSDDTGFNNTLNIMMDHTWDGFYTGQLHKAQFASMIETRGNYTILYTSTPPKTTRYTLRADRGAIKVKVQYWTAGTYAIKVNGETIPSTPWNKTAGSQSEITGLKGCGENRFVGVKNFLEFWLTAGCVVDVVPVDAILANVRMQWTLSEFYANGGVVSFADRVAGALGIQAYQIKTVAVYQGSVIVQYTITPANNDKQSTKTLSKLTTKLNSLVSSPDAAKVFGAPVLNATTNSQTIVGGTPKPTPNQGGSTVVTPAPIIQDTASTTSVTTKQPQSVTVATTTQTASKTNQTQVIVIVIVVLVLAIVVAIGVGLCIKNRMRKNITEASTVSQVVSGQGAIVAQNSEIALEPQFDAADFDVDIFTNKKRAIKKFNDDEVASKYYDNNDQFSSNIKLSVTDMSSKIELTDIKKTVAK